MSNFNNHAHFKGGRPGRIWTKEEDNTLREIHKNLNAKTGWMLVAFDALLMRGSNHSLTIDHVRRRAEKLGLRTARFKADKAKERRVQLAKVALREDWEKTNNLILRKPWGALCPIYRSCV